MVHLQDTSFLGCLEPACGVYSTWPVPLTKYPLLVECHKCKNTKIYRKRLKEQKNDLDEKG